MSPASRWVVGAVVLAAVVIGAFVSAAVLIQRGVGDATALAARDHAGDEVTALMAYVASERHSLRDRNRAVWALGRLADPRALPGLERYYDAAPCDHSLRLCQHELEKAIARCRRSPH